MPRSLEDVTFAIPLRLESEDRQENIVTVIRYLLKHFKTNIAICEEGEDSVFPRLMEQDWAPRVDYVFRKTSNLSFHKTRNLNLLYHRIHTPIIASYDSDVLFYPSQYVEAARQIRNNFLDFCYPFNEPTYDVSPALHLRLRETLTLNSVADTLMFANPMPPPGGCLFMNRRKLYAAGLENEKFISYGPEDLERRDRLRKLGYRVGSVKGKLFHLEHERSVHSTELHDMFRLNEAEHKRILGMEREELESYIRTWNCSREVVL